MVVHDYKYQLMIYDITYFTSFSCCVVKRGAIVNRINITWGLGLIAILL